MKKFVTALVSIVTVATFVFGMPGQSAALLIEGPDIIAAPASVINNPPGAVNDHQQAFNEKQGVSLFEDLLVDDGTIAAGTVVNSHMIFLNTEGFVFADDLQTWTFDGDILGVMSNLNGSLEVGSTPLLGLDTTEYPDTPFFERGLEFNEWYTAMGNTIEVYMSVMEPGDWIRVVTAADPVPDPVPEPGTMLLVGIGLTFFIGLRRKLKE